MPGMVIGQGVQPILGYNLGAKRYNLLLRAINIAAVTSTIISILAFLILYFLPEPLIRIFTDDAGVVSTGGYMAKLMFLSMPIVGLVLLGTQIFQATGKAVQSFVTAVARPAFLIPLVLLMSRAWQLEGVVLTFPTSDFITFVLIIFLIAPILRRYRKLAASASSGPDSSQKPGHISDPSEANMGGQKRGIVS
jgi:Na+-driven multidrug efflux pump